MAKGISLHIGLNHVDPAHYNGWDGELAACIQDANDMKALAESLGYTASMLIDKDATVRKVTKAITTAAAQLVAGDTFFLTYSGHGAQVPDRNGDEGQKDSGELGEFPDKYDETWVLYDRQLVDDELFYLWSLFAPKVGIVMFSDSCHSGTVARRLPWDVPVDAPANRRMPSDVEEETYAAHKRQYDAIQKKVPSRDASSIQATVVLISGCQDNQTSADGRVNGRFTARLLEVWNEGAFRGSASRLRKAIVAGMPPDQTPNYYVVGRPNKPLTTRQILKI